MGAANNGRATSLPPATMWTPAVIKANIPDEMTIQFIVFLLDFMAAGPVFALSTPTRKKRSVRRL